MNNDRTALLRQLQKYKTIGEQEPEVPYSTYYKPIDCLGEFYNLVLVHKYGLSCNISLNAPHISSIVEVSKLDPITDRRTSIDILNFSLYKDENSETFEKELIDSSTILL